MAQLNYFRGQTSGGVPAGLGQATNTGMAVGISKGMDALARGLEKFFQNKREKAEEDAYAELLKKLNEMPDTKEVGRKTSDEVMSAAMEGTENLPAYLTKAAQEGQIEQVPGTEFSGPMPLDPESIPDPSQTMMPTKQVPNPIFDQGLVFVPESGDYQPIVQDPNTGQYFPPAVPDQDGFITLKAPIPETVAVPDLPPGLPMQRPAPEFRATEAAMAGEQVPLSFAEQDQMRNQLIADYASRIGADRAEKLMGEQFKVHRDDAGNPVAYSLGKSMMAAPKTDPSFTEEDFIEFEVGGVKGVMNRRTGAIKLPTQEGALAEGIAAMKQMKEMNRASLVALKEAGTTHVYLDPKDKVFKDAALDDSRIIKHPLIEIEKAIASQTTQDTDAFLDAPE